MGGFISNPIDEEKVQRITEITANVCTEFSKQYVIGYTTALINKVKKDMTPSDEPEFRLKKRADKDKPEILMEGPVRRRDGLKPTDKKYESRYLILKSDFTLEYRVSKTGRLRDHMSLVDYSCYRESDEGHPHCLRLQHWRKRTFVFEFDSEELREIWAEHLWRACWRNNNFVQNPNPVQAEAFRLAYPETCAALGRSRREARGTEEEALTELSFYEVEHELLSGIRTELSANLSGMFYRWAMDAVDQTTNHAIKAAVSPAWGALQKQVEELHPTLEARVREDAGPLFEAQLQLRERVSEIVQPLAAPAMERLVAPIVERLGKDLTEHMNRAFAEAERQFELLCQEGTSTGGQGQGQREKEWAAAKERQQYETRSEDAGRVWPAVSLVRGVDGALQWCGEVVGDFDAHGTRVGLQGVVAGLVQDAQYTYEADVEKDGDLDRAGAFPRTRDALAADIATHRRRLLPATLLAILTPPVHADVLPLLADALAPLSDTVPAPFKALLDPMCVAAEIIDAQITDAVHAPFLPTDDRPAEP